MFSQFFTSVRLFIPQYGWSGIAFVPIGSMLNRKGCKVIIVTHFYGNRSGICYMANYLKVYYLTIVPFYNQAALPTIVGSLLTLRHIFRTESIQIVHGHSAFSTLTHEALFVGSLLNLGKLSPISLDETY